MPKATLEFRLPDEDYEYKLACDAAKMRSALEAIVKRFRDANKYSKSRTIEISGALQDIHDIIVEEGIDLG